MHTLSTQELVAVLKDLPSDHHLIDVRTSEEWAEGIIPGSQCITLPLLPLHLEELPLEDTYIMICRSGNRSGQACYLMEQKGYRHTINYAGGMLDWNAHHLPTLSPHPHDL